MSRTKINNPSNAEEESPLLEIGDIPLTDLLDFEQLTLILENFCDTVGIASAIIDLEGNILTHAHWQRICTDFHRVDGRTRARCIESDTELASNLKEGKEFSIYQCKNGLTDAASPLIIDGRHVANVFVGQFLLGQPNRDNFKKQALEFGFDREDYLKALDEVPIVSREKLPAILGFLTGFVHLLGFLGLERIKALEAQKLCMLSSEASEQAQTELMDYKAHLEQLVADRTEQLKDSEAYSRLILKSVAEGIFGTDLAGQCTFANEAAQQMLGYTMDELLGHSIHDLFHHSNADGSKHPKKGCPIYLSYTQGTTSFRRDEVFWRKDGSIFDVSYTSVPQKKGSTIIGSVVVFRDITRRKKAEDAIKESEYRLKTILSTTNEGFWWIDNDARTVAVNNTLCKFLDRPQEEILGKRPLDFLDAKNTAIMKEQLKRRDAGETGVYEIAFNRPDGTKVLCLLHATPLYDKNGKKTGAFALISDITQNKKMEEELIIARNKAEAANRAKSDFLANMSHEIRTPMNAVLGMTHLALNTNLTSKQKDYLTKIQISANSLLGIINDILDFSKIEAGKLRMESVDFNLAEVLENLSTQITIKAQEKEGLEVLFRIEPNVPRLLVGDPLRLGQVLVNLTNNAIKFTDHGEIVVSTELVRMVNNTAVIQFAIQDTGIGLTSKQKSRLFASFSQADTSITRKYGGSGLGLTICHRLVQMMGGKIWVDSTPGVGSTFYFTAVFGTSLEKARSRHLPPPDLRGIRVLVVDDNPTSQEIFQRMLKSFTFKVTLAATGEQGLQEIEKSIGKTPYGIVVMDWKLPGMNGIEAAKRIKHHSRLPHVPPIVLVSAYGREEIIRQAEAAGLEAFLIKPISPSVMFDTIMSVLAKDASKDLSPTDKKKRDSDVLSHLKGARLLVVEDNEINQQVAKEIFAGAGMIVSLADNGQQAVDMVKANKFDAVLMDLQMPVMDGYTATRIIREDTRFNDLPIIAMTAHAMAGDYEKSIDAGMVDHVTKPIDPDQVYAILARWIKTASHFVKKIESTLSGKQETPAATTADHVLAPAAEHSFPTSLDGFDLLEGLKRLQGNKVLYRRLLKGFASDYMQRANDIRQALDAGDYQNAHKIIHDIKGLAGNLAALQLHAAAAKLDKQVKDADITNPLFQDDLAKAFTSFETRMRQALRSVQQLESLSAELGIPPLPQSTGELPAVLAKEAAGKLRQAADIGDVSELEAIAEEMASRSKDFTPYASRIVELTNDFDFEGIIALADDIEKTQR